MHPVKKQILFDSPDLRVLHCHPAEGLNKTVAVTFTTWLPDPTVNLHRGFAQGLFLRRGIDEILVQNGRNDWYQNLSISDALAQMQSILARYHRVISYGASMGAYACLNFSNRLNADVCFAVSPQFSVDPHKVPFETRWLADVDHIDFHHDDLNGSLANSTRHVVVFDPKSRDAKHVALIDDRKITKVRLRHSGHFTLNTIKDLGLLSEFFECVTTSADLTDGFVQLYDARIKTSAWRVLSLAERAISTPNRLLMLWDRFKKDPPSEPMPFEKMGLYLLLARQYGQAMVALRSLPVLDQRPYALSLRARALLGLDDVDAARSYARQVIDLVGETQQYSVQLKALGLVT